MHLFRPFAARLVPDRKTTVPALARRLGLAGIACLLAGAVVLPAAEPEAGLRELIEQNRLLRDQAQRQQEQIDELRSHVQRLAGEVPDRTADNGSGGRGPGAERAGRQLVLSGFASINYFSGEDQNRYSERDFRVDEARLFVEAELRPGTYLFGELILAQREALTEGFQLGELYLEQENLLGDLLAPRSLNLRAGRVAVPFGEEYKVRSPVHNPLVTHSVTDFWGVDEGVVVYGEWEQLSYAFAVQNGGISRLRDWHKSKALVGRVGWAPLPGLYLGGSAMQTGKLDHAHEFGSEMWIGNNVFRSMGGAGTTRTFEADLAQFDARWRGRGGHVAGAVGTGRYRDDDTAANHRRTFDFFQVEAAHDVIGRLYAAARYSELRADRGYFLAGLGKFDRYFLGTELTRKIARLGVGGGYRFTNDLNLKFEYTFEDARRVDGTKRPDEDQFAAELAVKF